MSCNSKLFLQTWVFETTISKFFSSLESVYESYIQQSRWEKDKKEGKGREWGTKPSSFSLFAAAEAAGGNGMCHFHSTPLKENPSVIYRFLRLGLHF